MKYLGKKTLSKHASAKIKRTKPCVSCKNLKNTCVSCKKGKRGTKKNTAGCCGKINKWLFGSKYGTPEQSPYETPEQSPPTPIWEFGREKRRPGSPKRPHSPNMVDMDTKTMKKIGIYGSRSPERKKRSELVAKTVAKSLRRLGEYKDEPDEEQIRKARKTFFHINKTYNKLRGDTLRESKAKEHIPHQDPKVAREHMVKFYNKTRKVPKKTNKYYEYVMKARDARKSELVSEYKTKQNEISMLENERKQIADDFVKAKGRGLGRRAAEKKIAEKNDLIYTRKYELKQIGNELSEIMEHI